MGFLDDSQSYLVYLKCPMHLGWPLTLGLNTEKSATQRTSTFLKRFRTVRAKKLFLKTWILQPIVSPLAQILLDNCTIFLFQPTLHDSHLQSLHILLLKTKGKVEILNVSQGVSSLKMYNINTTYFNRSDYYSGFLLIHSLSR